MPVVVSVLNSYSGWAAAAAGFLLGNDLPIITGALVGSSGAYLSYIMCKAEPLVHLRHRWRLRRHELHSRGGGGRAPRGAGGRGRRAAGERVERRDFPAYGMAVAQAQYPVAELTRKLRGAGVEVRFGVHPAASENPGAPIAGMLVPRLCEVKDVIVFEAGQGHRLRGRAEPAVLPREHPDALRGRQGAGEDILAALPVASSSNRRAREPREQAGQDFDGDEAVIGTGDQQRADLGAERVAGLEMSESTSGRWLTGGPLTVDVLHIASHTRRELLPDIP